MSDDHSQLGAAPATPLDRDVREFVDNLHAYARAVHIQFCSGKQAHDGVCSSTIELAEQADALFAAPAQPDARDAEIARLKEELEAATATIEDEQAAHEETRADAARLTKEPEEAREKGLLDGHDLVNLRQQVEDTIGNAQTDADGDGWITAYHFNTGSIHRLLAMARDIRPHQGRVFRTVGPPVLAPPEPKAETEPMVFCGAVEPGHDGEHRRTPRCWYPHKAGEARPADWVNIPRAAPPPAETAGQKEGLTALQSRVAAWVRLAFREEALTDRWERAARVVEEAIELGQAEGLDHEDVYRIWQRVYSRGAGDVEQEAGGVMVCLLAWAAGRETSLAACALREIERIEQPATVEKIRRKQAEKAKAGTGHDFAPPTPSAAQPSQDVAGTSGESLAGLSKEGGETP